MCHYQNRRYQYFKKDNILLTSECGFGHVPIDIVRAKIKKLVSVAKELS